MMSVRLYTPTSELTIINERLPMAYKKSDDTRTV
jgi:hypothetical protein